MAAHPYTSSQRAQVRDPVQRLRMRTKRFLQEQLDEFGQVLTQGALEEALNSSTPGAISGMASLWVLDC